MMNLTKRLTFLILSLMILTRIADINVYAAGNVSYEGSAGGFIFAAGTDSAKTDLFENFKYVMPGDELADSVEIKNKSKEEVRIYMKALGAVSGSEEFLSQLGLVVRDGDIELFNSTADASAQMTEWVLLGSFAPGADRVLDLTLLVPIEMGDDFQNAIGELEWLFKVEEDSIPEEPGEVTPPADEPPEIAPPAKEVPGSPKTGDHSSIIMYILGILIASPLLISVECQRRINRRH